MKYYIKLMMLLPALLIGTLSSYRARAQAPGSEETTLGLGLGLAAGGTHSSLSESLYIGPGNYQIDGTWEIYSKTIWISPAAVITGSGLVKFFNPAAAGGVASASFMDGNNSTYIDVNIELQNAAGMQLADRPTASLPADIQGVGWANTVGNSTLKVGRDFNLALDGANVVLDNTATGDFVFDSDGTVSNYRPTRMVVTNNSIQSHMVKDGAASGFIFPLSIAPNDYTPAKITGSGVYHASVQDYTASTPNEATLPHGGIARTWHIYSDAPGTAIIDLEHNKATETAYTDNSAYVTQYLSSVWSTTSCSSGTGSGTLTTGGSISTASELSGSLSVDNTNTYYTKTGCVVAVSDLSPVIYARPSTISGTKPLTVVVEVYELNGVATSGLITVKLSKDPKVSLNFTGTATSVGGQVVQNSAWNFDAVSDDDYYVLTSSQAIAAGDLLAFGLSGTLTPGATSGTLTFTTVIGPGSGGETLITNNTDADKVDFFQQ